MEGAELVNRFTTVIIDPAILLIFALGFFLFVWGLVQFLWSLDESSNRQDGIRHMTWGIVGMLVMVTVKGIILLLSATFDLGIGADGSYNPDTSYLRSLFRK